MKRCFDSAACMMYVDNGHIFGGEKRPNAPVRIYIPYRINMVQIEYSMIRHKT